MTELPSLVVSPAVRRLREAATIGATRRANELKQTGRDILVISGGQPDFDTPEHIKDAAKRAIDQGYTKYMPTDGAPVLKDAIIEKFAQDYDLSVGRKQVVVGTGGKQILFNALYATVSEGDEVIIPLPCYPSYPDIVELMGATPVYVKTRSENGFKLTAKELEAGITPRTRWLVLNSPNNPTGMVYSYEELSVLAEVLMRNPHVWILSDDIYEHITYDGIVFESILKVEARLSSRTLVMNGVSKGHCMTGWRIGYGVGPEDLISAMVRLQGQETNGASSISQMAAVAALTGPMDFIAVHNEVYQRRRDFVVSAINSIDGLSCLSPAGAIYVFVDVSGLIGRSSRQGRTLESDLDVANHFLEAGGVAVVPGAGFGMSPFARLCFAYSDAEMEEACRRIERAVTHDLEPR